MLRPVSSGAFRRDSLSLRHGLLFLKTSPSKQRPSVPKLKLVWLIATQIRLAIAILRSATHNSSQWGISWTCWNCGVSPQTAALRLLVVLAKHGGSKRSGYAGCTRKALKGGKCFSHGGGHKCSHQGCVKQALIKGMCVGHVGSIKQEPMKDKRMLQGQRKKGAPPWSITVTRTTGICRYGGLSCLSKLECLNQAFSKRRCIGHSRNLNLGFTRSNEKHSNGFDSHLEGIKLKEANKTGENKSDRGQRAPCSSTGCTRSTGPFQESYRKRCSQQNGVEHDHGRGLSFVDCSGAPKYPRCKSDRDTGRHVMHDE
ncbi:unnamed protein product [Phytophthora lilii]|uniref:Unnamed protein product n=1 Tax=Phytophthora lilii TaxID=2077276 RepID=A0A9W6WLP0_9STRA|nr:unnamed protein product [Phytophthora lilii]